MLKKILLLFIYLTSTCTAAWAADKVRLADVPSFLGEAKFDHSGMRVAYAGDVDGSGRDAFLIAAPNNGEGGNNAGKVYLMLGRPQGWQANQSLASAAPVSFIGEEANDNAGLSIGFIGDVNGDGLDDILIGAPNNSENGVHTGKCYLFFGRKSWKSTYNLSEADAVFLGEREGDLAGAAVSYAGDVNGDGLADFLIGAPGNREGGENAGKVYLLMGRRNWPKRMRLYYADASFTGGDKDDKAGSSLAFAGDVNGDGYDDFLIGAPGSAVNGTESGQVYLILGHKTGWKTGVILSHADASFTGEGEDNNAGFAISYAGDVDGDGLADFIIGAPNNSQAGNKAGKCYIIPGRKTGWKMRTPLAQSPVSITGEKEGDRFGTSLAYAGDVNGDGLGDFVVGANRNSEANERAGKIYLFYGRTQLSQNIEARAADMQYLGEQKNDLCGGYMAYAGDVNGGGLPGFVIGADSSSQSAHAAGKTYLVVPGINSPPAQISQLKLMADQSFQQELATQPKIGGELFIQLTGPHPASHTINAATVDVSTSPSDKLAVRLTETAPDSGIFRGRIKLARTGTERFARRLAVHPGDIIKIVSRVDPKKSIQTGLCPALATYSVVNNNGQLKAGETAELALKITNYYYQPLKGVKVTLLGTDPYIKLIKSSALVGDMDTGQSRGNKEKLEVSIADNYPPGYRPSLKLLIQAQPNLSWQEDFPLKMNRTVAIRGHISDKCSGQPVAKAKVFYGKQTIAAKSDGSFTIYLPQSDKPVLLRVGASEYLFWKSQVNVRQDQELDVKLPPRWRLDNAAASFVGEAPHDFSGWTVTCVGDVNGDGYDDFVVAAKNNGAGGTGAGQVYLFFGHPGGWEKGLDLSKADASFIGEAAGDEAGYVVAGVGDINGSGFDSFVIGAPGNSQAGDKAGKVYLITGKVAGWKMRMPLNEAASATFIGEKPGDRAGFALSYAGDVNGDGYNDILIGAPGSNGNGLHSGQVYIIFGKPDGWGRDMPLADADASFVGETSRDEAGRAVSYAGDVNGDGYDDFLIGAPDYMGAKDFCGRTYLILGHPPAGRLMGGDTGGGKKTLKQGWGRKVSLSQADVIIEGEGTNDASGSALSYAGDVNGDGLGDFLIGAWANNAGGRNAGQTYLFLGRRDWPRQMNVSDADASFIGEREGDNAGAALAYAGDVAGTGYDAFLVGAPGSGYGDMAKRGQTYLIMGKPDGWKRRTSLGYSDLSFMGVNKGNSSGKAVSWAGDVDGDGYDEMLIGAWGESQGGNNAGRTYLLKIAWNHPPDKVTSIQLSDTQLQKEAFITLKGISANPGQGGVATVLLEDYVSPNPLRVRLIGDGSHSGIYRGRVCFADTSSSRFSRRLKAFGEHPVIVTASSDGAVSRQASVSDTGPPYLDGIYPLPLEPRAPVNVPLSLHIKDDGTGVDKASIKLSVDGKTVIPKISGTKQDYILAYKPSSVFDFAREIKVGVSAGDLSRPPHKLQTEYSFTSAPAGTLFNPGFEDDFNCWSYEPVPGASVSIDPTVAHSGLKSCKIEFSGESDVQFQHLFQGPIPVQPETNYLLRAYIKTEDINSEEGIRLYVEGSPTMARLEHPEKYFYTESFSHLRETNDWTEVTLSFTTLPDTHFLFVYIKRNTGGSISGTCWVDDFYLMTEFEAGFGWRKFIDGLIDYFR